MGIVWTYWENRPGEPTPAHIQLCRAVLRHQCQGCDLRLITSANVHQYLPDLDPRVWRITLTNPEYNPIAVRCAFIRAFLLERYGGLYVDADCIALKDFAEVFRLTDGYDFFAMRRTSAKTNHISIGFYGTAPQGQVITAYADALRAILKEKTCFRWAEVGAHLLTPIVDRQLERVFLFPESQIHPIVAEEQHRLADTEQALEEVVPKDAHCVMLFHKIFEQEIKGATLAGVRVREMYQGQSLVARLFRQSYPEHEFRHHFGRRGEKAEGLSLPEKAPAIATRYETDKLIERIGYWVPPGDFQPQGAVVSKTNLKIAAVVEERLYQGLRYEAQMLLLTPNNWRHILSHAKPDLLLMESTWTTATGHWHLAQLPPARERETLCAMVILARKMGIPTVFWHTKDQVYHEHYKSFARYFDAVFCADPREAELLRREGIKAEVLLPCAQPAWAEEGPIAGASKKSIPILYDGWADLDKLTDELAGMEQLKPLGLRIIESRYQIFHQRRSVLPQYQGHILGCVSPSGRRAALRRATRCLTCEKTVSTAITQQWMALEAIALGTPVIHQGTLDEDDPRQGLVRVVKEQGGLPQVIQPSEAGFKASLPKGMQFGERLALLTRAIR